MAKRKPNFFWHVSDQAWTQADAGGPGIPNVLRDIVLILVESMEPLADEPVVPSNDEFVVERVIGQWKMNGLETAGATTRMFMERCYVTTGNAESVALRNLWTDDEADTSFLFTKTNVWVASHDGDALGNWTGQGLNNHVNDLHASPVGLFYRDIRVGRRIKEGEMLVYHWQFNDSVTIPSSGSYWVQPWIRTLVRQG